MNNIYGFDFVNLTALYLNCYLQWGFLELYYSLFIKTINIFIVVNDVWHRHDIKPQSSPTYSTTIKYFLLERSRKLIKAYMQYVHNFDLKKCVIDLTGWNELFMPSFLLETLDTRQRRIFQIIGNSMINVHWQRHVRLCAMHFSNVLRVSEKLILVLTPTNFCAKEERKSKMS